MVIDNINTMARIMVMVVVVDINLFVIKNIRLLHPLIKL